MKCVSRTIFMVMILTSFCRAQESTSQKPDWINLGIAWENYLQDPTIMNGNTVCSILPNQKMPKSEYNWSVYSSIYDNLEKLESLIRAQDRMAAEIAFQLYSISDSVFTRALNKILGELIVINPRIFLEELQSHIKSVPKLHDLVYIVLDQEFIDRLEGVGVEKVHHNFGMQENPDPQTVRRVCIIEYKRRIQALETVKANELIRIRDECISDLNYALDTMGGLPSDKVLLR